MKEHHWSGWPGAICLDCGQEDFLEVAIGNGWYDPFSGEWLNEEAKKEYEKVKWCPVDYNPKCPQCNPNLKGVEEIDK